MAQRAGKLTPAVLEKIVLPYTGAKRREILRGSGIGVDAALVQLGNSLCLFSMDPITGSSSRSGELCIYVSCNDLAAAGAEPVCVGITLIVPAELGEGYVASFMADADRACKELGVAIACGHTELSEDIPVPLVSVAALGKPWPDAKPFTGVRVGDSLVLTKGAGIEGAAILATDFATRLQHMVGTQAVEAAQRWFRSLSVIPEARVAAAWGVAAMHDVTEGGVLGAAWEMVSPVGLGVEVWADRVPVPPEVGEICAAVGVDPLRLVSSGSLLVAVADGEGLSAALRSEGIPAAVIGRVKAGDSCVIRNAFNEAVAPPDVDELWRAREFLSRL